MGSENLEINEPKRKKDSLTNTLEQVFSPRKVEDPRNETFWDMLYINLFPNLKFFSFTIFLSFALLIIFTVHLILSGINMPGQFLEILNIRQSILVLDLEHFINGHFYRLITAAFVHSSMPALGNSIIILFIWISSIEHSFGIIRTFIIFCITAVTANLFGLMFASYDIFLSGADAGVFGLLGAALGYILFNWKRLNDRDNSRLSLFWMVALICIFSMLFGSSKVVVMTQLGGVLDGIFVGLFFSPIIGGNGFFSYGKFTCYEYTMFFIGLFMHCFITFSCFIGNFYMKDRE